MQVSTKQEPSFADSFIEISPTELDTLDDMVDWQQISANLARIKGDYAPLSLFKMLLLQTWHNMPDVSIANALCRDIVFMRFCGFTLDGKKPDGSTICRFRNRLISHNILDKLLLIVNHSLEQRKLKIANGKYVAADATLISSSRRPRKSIDAKEVAAGVFEADKVVYSADSDASWKKKGDKFIYGYSGYFTTDEPGLIEAVSTLPANKSEMSNFPQVMESANLPANSRLLYDKGADSKANRQALANLGLRDGIMRKKPKGKKMSYWQKLRNKLISKRRFVVERTFGTLKRTYGFSRARYLGLDKTQGESVIKSIAYNLKRANNLHRQRMHYCA
jgi:IS5 family transposase